MRFYKPLYISQSLLYQATEIYLYFIIPFSFITFNNSAVSGSVFAVSGIYLYSPTHFQNLAFYHSSQNHLITSLFDNSTLLHDIVTIVMSYIVEMICNNNQYLTRSFLLSRSYLRVLLIRSFMKNFTTMTSADFCAFSTALDVGYFLSEHTTQTSLGTTRFLFSIHLPNLSCMIPCGYRAST